jgi:hypothetical protein
LLVVEGKAPTGPDELVQELLGRLPNDATIWRRLAAQHTIRLTFGIFFGTWNRTFELSPTSMRRLADLGVPVGFSIYADGDEVRAQLDEKTRSA